MTLQFVRVEDVQREYLRQRPGDFRAWIARLCLDGAITSKLAERAHYAHCRAGRSNVRAERRR